MARLVTGESAGVFGSYASVAMPQAGIGTVLTTPAVPLTTVPVTNTLTVPVTVTVIGGTGTNVAINGTLQGTFDGSYTVPPGGTIALTYSAAPTWAWSVPVIPASGVAAVNPSTLPVQVVITGGAMSNVSVNGQTVGSGAGTYTVPGQGSIVMTYTTVPTWTWAYAPSFLAAVNANGTPVKQTGAG